MKALLAALLAAVLVYLLYDTWSEATPLVPRTGRLCDFTVAGAVFEDVPSAIKRGVRLLEVHIYSDERDQPVVATSPQMGGSDVAVDNVSFESVCVDIANDAFPSKDPFILSMVLHTDRTVTINKVAEHLQTIPRKFLSPETHIQTVDISRFANTLLLVSGGAINGTALEPLLNLNWSDPGVRRLTYQQAITPRDPEELKQFTRSGIVLVAPEPQFKTIVGNPGAPLAFGCQWNLFATGPPGFVAKESRSST
jgi:hypothetical protein